MVISDHGFQTHVGRFSLWRWLEEAGYLHAALADAAAEGAGKGEAGLDPVRSAAIPGGRSNEAFIWLTEEGAARERTGNELRKGLEEVRDPVTGAPVVERVRWREDLYRGDRLEDLPDLVVIPAGGWSITGRREPEAELFRSVVPGEDFHVGRHHPDGIVVAAGAGVRPEPDLRIRLIDIAPTVLASLGIAPPPGMDGTVLPFMPAGGSPAPGVDRDGGQPGRRETDRSQGDAYTPEEQELVEKRLRDLGYL
jgi:predicted AlkP superfamily phosphohydrolase/phosphomutase